MKTIFLGLMFLFLAALMFMLVYSLWRLIRADLDDDYIKKTPTPWKAVFNPTNGKFFISRHVGKKTFFVSNRFGFKKSYKDQLEAELVVDLLNK